MIWAWSLGIFIVLLILLCMTRVGAFAAVREGTLLLDVKIGWIRLHILPKKSQKSDPAKEAKAAEKKAAAQAKKEARKAAKKAGQGEGEKGFSVKTEQLKTILADVESAVHALWPPLKRALNRTRKGIRIDPMQVNLVVGAREDPAEGAKMYGYLHAGVWTVMPLLEQVLDIPGPYIHVGVDFESDDTSAEGEAGISIRIGTLLAVGFTVAVPALRWFLKWNKQKKQTGKVNAETTKKG